MDLTAEEAHMVGLLVLLGYFTCCAVFVDSLFEKELEQTEP